MNISDCGSEHSLGQAHRRHARPPPRSDHRPRAGRDDGPRPAMPCPTGSSASPRRWARRPTRIGDGIRAVGVRRILSRDRIQTLRAAGVVESQAGRAGRSALADDFIQVAPAAWPEPEVRRGLLGRHWSLVTGDNPPRAGSPAAAALGGAACPDPDHDHVPGAGGGALLRPHRPCCNQPRAGRLLRGLLGDPGHIPVVMATRTEATKRKRADKEDDV